MWNLRNFIKLTLTIAMVGAFSNAPLAEGGKAKTSSKANSNVQVTDQQIGQFVKAQKKIRNIVQNNRKVLMKKKKGKEHAEVQSKMASAIKDAGLEVETYNKIAQAVQQDQNLRKRFMQKMSNSQN